MSSTIFFVPITPRRLKDPSQLIPALTTVMEKFVEAVNREMATYPPRKYVSIKEAGGWASDKQRRWFFWALKRGKIEVPYKRTMTLGRSWQHRVATESDRVVGVVASQGEIAPYNVYVQGPRQTAMMKLIGWKRPEDIYKPHWSAAMKSAIAIMQKFANS